MSTWTWCGPTVSPKEGTQVCACMWWWWWWFGFRFRFRFRFRLRQGNGNPCVKEGEGAQSAKDAKMGQKKKGTAMNDNLVCGVYCKQV